MVACVLLSLSHFTKKASSGLLPWKAPARNSELMNALMLNRIAAHSGSSLGSNTTHCVPRYSETFRKFAVRRTGTYRYSGLDSVPIVRVPQHTIPDAANWRMQFTPIGFRVS